MKKNSSIDSEPKIYKPFITKSKFQKIEVRSNKAGTFLYLNNSLQVHSNEEAKYHECIATTPMMMARNAKEILILGGGDGLAARNVLDFPNIRSVTLVELDKKVVDVCSTHPKMKELNAKSLKDPRVQVIIGDAIEWLIKTKRTFDVIIHDIEDCWTTQPDELSLAKYIKFYTALFSQLKTGGVWVITFDNSEKDEMLEATFDAIEEHLPASVKRRYHNAKDTIARSKILLEQFFPYIQQWNINFPILGKHTTFYISGSPLKKFYRSPKSGIRFISKKILSNNTLKTSTAPSLFGMLKNLF